MNMYEIERLVIVSVIGIWYGMVKRIGWVIEQDQGFEIDYLVSNHAPAT